MRWSNYIYRSVLIVFVTLTLIGCSTSKEVIMETHETSTEPITIYETPTPDDQMALVKSRLIEEMRIFDVGAHHDALYNQIKNIEKNLSEGEVKEAISEIVTTYMDGYFLEKTHEILSEYNDSYAISDVETLFESTSRTSLYTLIELYEWSFYNKNQ